MPITNPEFQFSNSNGYTFGSSARTVTMSGSYAGLGFSGTNITATMGTNGLQLSVAAPGGGAAINFSAGTTSGNLQSVVFSNSNGVSFGLNGSTITASASGAGGGVAVKGSGTYSQNTGTVEFANSNGITFGLSDNGTMTASHNGLTSQSNQAASASNGSFAFQTLNFSNANNVTFGTSAGSIITASVAAPGAAAENNWFNLAGNTTGNTTASGSTILLSAGNNVTLSGTNNSVIRIDAGGGGFTADVVAPYKDYIATAGQVGNNTVRFDPVIMPNFIWRSAGHFISCTNVSNSSGSFSLSMWMGIYTRTGGTLSIEASMSGSTAFTMSGTLGSWASYSGQRNFTISGAATTITEGQKWVAFMSKTSSAAGGNNMTISNLVVSQSAQPWAIPFGVQLGVNTHQEVLGRGMYSLTTAALPASLGFTDISGTASQFKYPPIIQLFATSY